MIKNIEVLLPGMQKIFEEKYHKRLKENFVYDFETEKEGLYLIEVLARVKSAKQIGTGATDDDDLRIEIDGRRFSKLDNPQRYLDSPAAFSGGQLHGLSKAVYFLINFSSGNHQLTFIPDQSPLLEKLAIYFINDSAAKVNLNINQQAEDGDRRPWLTFVLVDLPLESLTAEVTASWRWPDSDDVKLIIDNQIQKNPLSLLHKNWLWRANIFKKLFQTEIQTKTIKTNLPPGLHYLEFWADRMPVLHNLELDFGAIVGRIPNEYDPKWTGDFEDDSEQMILARAIWGEARGISKKARIAVAWSIKNRLGMKDEWGTYHNIILAKAQYSAFWEESSKDPNLTALRDPLGTTDNPADHQKWRETYQIAGQVINNEIPDPTNGANHYYDDSIVAPYWVTDDSFNIKIDNLNFHHL